MQLISSVLLCVRVTLEAIQCLLMAVDAIYLTIGLNDLMARVIGHYLSAGKLGLMSTSRPTCRQSGMKLKLRFKKSHVLLALEAIYLVIELSDLISRVIVH